MIKRSDGGMKEWSCGDDGSYDGGDDESVIANRATTPFIRVVQVCHL